jgi:hypothetical protein
VSSIERAGAEVDLASKISGATQRTEAKENKALQEIRVFSEVPLIFGLPSKLFVGGLVMGGAMALMVAWYIGLTIGVIYFGVMFAIHAEDDKGLQAWTRSFGRAPLWTLNTVRHRRVLILRDGD